MILLRRSWVFGAAALVVAGWGGTRYANRAGQSARTSLTSAQVSPCGSVNLATAWSPSGEQVAWYGYRWPLPPLHHRPASISVLRAICVADADGKHVLPLPHTVCSERCIPELSDPPGQLDWAGPNLLLYGSDAGIFTLSVGEKPKLLGRTPPVPFSADSAGDRVATGFSECPRCAGPVTVREVPSGKLVGRVGGKKLDNIEPSLSPDGTQVVFVRNSADDPARPEGIWTAAADGSRLRRLERNGNYPLWSPAGDRIAYSTAGGVRLVAPQGGAGTTLLRSGVRTVFSWSPDGRRIAFADSSGKLAVVDVATRKVRRLLKLHLPYSLSSFAWSPDSQQLLVVWRAPTGSGCPSGLWRVSLNGTKRLVHGC